MKLAKLFVFITIISALIFSIFYFSPSQNLSADQLEAQELFGDPAQFIITYLPQGESELARSETWIYPDASKKITFLSGISTAVEDYQPEEEITQINLKPQDFDFSQTYEDLVDIFGIDNIEEINFIPGLYEEGQYNTYLTDQALFIIENGQLIYFQTLDQNNNPIIEEEEVIESTPIPQVSDDQKNYISSDLGFEIKYPQDWFLSYGVLSSYDTDYLSKGLELPEKILKCDFTPYNPDDTQIINEQTIFDQDFKIKKGRAQNNSEYDDFDFEGVTMFTFERQNKDTIALICFAYDQDFEPKLLNSLETFKFLD